MNFTVIGIVILVIATVAQAGLSHVDAIEMAHMLNQRARRAILQ